MKWVAALANLFQAIGLYFSLKNRSFYYDIHNKSRQQQKQYIEELERLRAIRSPDAADDADLVRMQLLEEKQFYKHITTTFASVAPLSGNQNL
jgi:hypothetical protein